MNVFYIVTFNNTHEAMQAEDICIKEKIKVVMMPTPTYITKSCGISLKVDEIELGKLKDAIVSDKLKYKSIYQFLNNKAIQIDINV